MQDLDEMPIGAKGAYEIPEEEGPIVQEEEPSGPIEKRLVSKVWKLRTSAFEELKQILESSEESVFGEYADSIPKFIGDPHPGAQEKALSLLSLYIDRASSVILPYSELIVFTLLEKGLSSAKSNLKQQATELLLSFFAVQDSNFEAFFAGIQRGLSNKNLKVQTSSLAGLNALMAGFGLKQVPFKPFISAVEKFASASNSALRSEALNFYKECYRWIREGIFPMIEKLKKAQQDELKKAFEDISEPPVPTRKLKGEEEVEEAPKMLDVYEMTEAQDIFVKFNDRWADRVLAMENWTEKKEALEELNQAANYPKLADRSALPLVTMAKRLVMDSNLQVVLQSIKLIGLLAKGQRKFFDSYAKQCFTLLLQKFKDKKAQVKQETHLALDNLMYSLSVDSILDDLKLALEDKTPSVKVNTSQWIQRALNEENAEKISLKIVHVLKKNTDDSVAEVRNSALELLNSLLQRAPDSVRPVIADLNKAKMQKLSNFVAEETKTVPKKGKPVAKPPLPVKHAEEEIEIPENAEDVVAEILPEDVMVSLRDPNWKTKVQGLQDMQDWINSHTEEVFRNSEVLAKFSMNVCKDWKESNFNINRSVIDVLSQIAGKSQNPEKLTSICLTPPVIEKVGDSKLADSFNCFLSVLCEKAGVKKVVGLLVKHTSESSKPKIVAEATQCLSKLISDYGVLSLNVKEIVVLGKNSMSQTNPMLKKSGQALLCTLYTQIGPALISQLSDLKDSTLRSLEEEFRKLPVNVQSEDIFPKASLSISPELLSKFSHSNWLTRKEALEELERLISQSGGRFQASGLDSLFRVLKARLSDSNKSLIRQSLALIGRLAEGLGADSSKFAKLVIPPILSSLADKQQMLRQEALLAIDRFGDSAGPEFIINEAGEFLAQDNPETRQILLTWILQRREFIAQSDARSLVVGDLACLQDRSVNIRVLGEELFGELISIVGFEAFQPHLQDIKPAVMAGLRKIFERFGVEPIVRAKSPNIRKRNSPSPAIKKPRSFSREQRQVPIKRPASAIQGGMDISIVNPMGKEKRLEAEAKSKWSVDEIRPDYALKLKEQMRQCFSHDLHTLLFHSDFKRQAEAAGYLTRMANSPDTVQVIDLIFKWIWVKLSENNTQLMKAVLELCAAVVKSLPSISDPEAALFLPILCEKSGSNNAQFRAMIREIIVNSCKIHPPDKVLVFLLQGLNSKNSKSRVECLETIAAVIHQYSLSMAAKDIKAVVKMVNSPDGAVRQGALLAMSETYKIRGPKVWELIGEIPDKVRGMLEQRFKTCATPTRPASRSPAPATRTLKFKSEEERMPRKNSLTLESKIPRPIEMLAAKTPEKELKTFAEDNIPDLETPEHSIDQSLLYEPNNFNEPFTELDKHIEVLKIDEMSSKVDALVAINDIIMNKLSLHAEELSSKADDLIEAFNKVLSSVFDREEIPMRFAKFFLNVVVKVASTRFIVRAINEHILLVFLDLLYKKTLLESVAKMPHLTENDNLVFLLNSVIMKLMENADHTLMYCALLKLLTQCSPSNSSMRAVVIKSVQTMSKAMGGIVGSLESDRILLAIHEYLTSNSREHLDSEDLAEEPLKMLVGEIILHYGQKIWVVYEPLKTHLKTDRTIKKWIEQLLINPHAVYNPPAHNLGLNRDPVLTNIFKRLLDISSYSFAIKDLHKYIEEKPQVNLSPFLASCSPEMYERITEDLQKLKDEPNNETVNFQDFQNRLVLIKQRYGMASEEAPAQLTSTLSELKAKVNSLLSKASNLAEQTDLINDVKNRINTLNRQ